MRYNFFVFIYWIIKCFRCFMSFILYYHKIMNRNLIAVSTDKNYVDNEHLFVIICFFLKIFVRGIFIGFVESIFICYADFGSIVNDFINFLRLIIRTDIDGLSSLHWTRFKNLKWFFWIFIVLHRLFHQTIKILFACYRFKDAVIRILLWTSIS